MAPPSPEPDVAQASVRHPGNPEYLLSIYCTGCVALHLRALCSLPGEGYRFVTLALCGRQGGGERAAAAARQQRAAGPPRPSVPLSSTCPLAAPEHLSAGCRAHAYWAALLACRAKEGERSGVSVQRL